MASEELSALDQRLKARDERKAAQAKKRKAQRDQDLVALDDLEIEHGDGFVKPVELDEDMYLDGLPTMVIVRVPSRPEGKRYRDQVKSSKADIKKILEAQEMLGASCRVYPDKETYERMLDKVEVLASRVNAVAVKLAQGGEAEEGKG